VSRSARHRFCKEVVDAVLLVRARSQCISMSDAMRSRATIQHRSASAGDRSDPQPRDRSTAARRAAGRAAYVGRSTSTRGQIGENITTRGVDALCHGPVRPCAGCGSRADAVVQVTGLRIYA
jgi:hypothetical protein